MTEANLDLLGLPYAPPRTLTSFIAHIDRLLVEEKDLRGQVAKNILKSSPEEAVCLRTLLVDSDLRMSTLAVLLEHVTAALEDNKCPAGQ